MEDSVKTSKDRIAQLQSEIATAVLLQTNCQNTPIIPISVRVNVSPQLQSEFTFIEQSTKELLKEKFNSLISAKRQAVAALKHEIDGSLHCTE